MTLWAFVSDVHDRGDRLKRVLSDAQAQGAARIVALGDIGSTSALDALDAAGATCVFGNWEASGLRGLPALYRNWVARWPALFRAERFWAAHASPVWPAGLAVSGVVDYLRTRDLHWTAIFPSLLRSDDARWAALTELEAGGGCLFFHGHTHVQEAWRWMPGGVPVRVNGSDFTVEDGERWLVGVGSVGIPHDGDGACYALYDDVTQRVTWRRI
jgi:hypothetical protein